MKKFLLGVLLVFGVMSAAYALNEDQENLLLQSMGNAISTGAYSMYIAIGGVADLYGNDVYKAKTAKSVVAALGKRCSKLSEYLGTLLDEEVVTGSDVSFLKGVIQTYEYLADEAEDYVAYIDDTTDENFDSYNDNREAAWKGIEKMMGWDDDE